MNKQGLALIFLITCLTSVAISATLFLVNVIVFFVVLVLYLQSLSDDEFDDLDND